MTDREQSLARRREWSAATREMLARSYASGHRVEPHVGRIDPKHFAGRALATLVEQSHKLQVRRRGQIRRARDAQASAVGRHRKPVTLAPVKLECEL